MHLFVTLLINKTNGSDNRHFLFNTLKNENKEEFLTGSTCYTYALIEKNMSRKRLSQDAESKVDLNKYGSYFKFILLLSGATNLNPGPATPQKNDILWELLLFHNFSFSNERMDYQLDFLSVVSNDGYEICFILSSELEIEEYDVVRFDWSRRGGGVACFVKSSVSCNRKPFFSLIQNVFL